jgi:hypothetical protein
MTVGLGDGGEPRFVIPSLVWVKCGPLWCTPKQTPVSLARYRNVALKNRPKACFLCSLQ